MILREEDKKQLLEIADQAFKTPVEIWAYGSRVDGTAHDTSDLDLVLRTKDLSPIDIDEITHFKELITDSTLPILIQFSDWARLPQSFHKNILQNYEVLYSPNKNNS